MNLREYFREVFYQIDPSTMFLTFDWDWLAKSVNAYGKNVLKSVKLPSMGVFLSVIQRRIMGPRFAEFRGRKQREIQNWICNLGNLSQTRAICMTAFQEMTCFLLFVKFRDYTVPNSLVSNSNGDDGT